MSEELNNSGRPEAKPSHFAGHGYAEALQRLEEPGTRRSPRASPAVSFTQQQVWLHTQLAPNAPLYNEVLILERTGALDRAALERSLCEINRRHEILRTTFPAVDGTVVPAVAEHQAVELRVTNLNSLPESYRQPELMRIATEEARRPFDLTNGPLLRARLLCLSAETYVVVITLHALVADQESLNILSRELGALYHAYSAGEPSPLPDPPMQYADYVRWQRSGFEGDVLAQHLAYWRKRLAGIPTMLDLPTDRARPPVQGFHGARESLKLSKRLSESLKDLSQSEGVTLSITMLSAFQVLLSRYTGQSDIVVGTVVAGREAAGTENVIGPFAHTVIIRTDVETDPTFRELLRQVRDRSRRDLEYGSIPFDRIVGELQPERDPSRNPLFQVLFSLTPSATVDSSGWEGADFDVDNGAAKVDLTLQFDDKPEGMIARFTYNKDIFDSSTVNRMAGHFQTLLQGIVNNPDERLSRLPLLTEAERHQLLVEWNNTQAHYPKDRCVHHLFESQVERYPNATAVVFENERLTYRELNDRANQLARHLMKLGVGPDVLVGILVERSLEMVVGLLGILKAGGAYVPLDPAYPPERVAYMLEDSEVTVLLTQQRLLGGIPETCARVVVLDAGWDEIATEEANNPVTNAAPQSLAYVIYTSGSTGKPKGVQIPHRAVVNFLTSMSLKPGMTEKDRLLAVTTLCFDIAGLEIYLPLIVGACVEIVARQVASDGSQLLSRLVSSDATVMQATPATWRMLFEAGWQGSPHLKVLCGGEAVSRALADQLLQKAGSVWNVYGPTETTIWSTTTNIEAGQTSVPIGPPIANTQLFVLDKLLQPVPIGVAGELHIGGDGLARGYLHRPELTAEKFIADPFSQDPEARLYKTGDLVRYLRSGDIEFLGRIDHQIKIRGFRIELGEIEALLRQHPAVNEAVATVRENGPGDQRLVAYFLPAEDSIVTYSELRDFLKEKLPEYMVPSAFVRLTSMPLTPNGKINRRALPAPDQTDLASQETFAAAKDVIESRLVQIWETVLGMRPISVTQNFFLELGGHSLVAVRLMQRIEQAFGKKLPPATLFQAPTIEQLAAILRENGWSAPWTSLVAIQPGGTKSPFFCVHGAGGAVIRFFDLAQYLGSDQPVYGLQATGAAGNDTVHSRVEDMAAAYIREIRTVQPEGPYLLGGYSFGGIVALEMAQQLIAQGRLPRLVVLFDTFCPSANDTFGEKCYAVFKTFRVPPDAKPGHVSRKMKTVVRGLQRRLSEMRVPRELKQVRRTCQEAAKAYVLRAYPGRIILFRSSERPMTHFHDHYAGWSAVACGGLEIHEIGGDHDDVLLEPQVQLVAEQLKACLNYHPAAHYAGQLINA